MIKPQKAGSGRITANLHHLTSAAITCLGSYQFLLPTTLMQYTIQTTVVLIHHNTLKTGNVRTQPAYTIIPMYNVTIICLRSNQLLLLYYKPMITPANTIIPVLSLIIR